MHGAWEDASNRADLSRTTEYSAYFRCLNFFILNQLGVSRGSSLFGPVEGGELLRNLSRTAEGSTIYAAVRSAIGTSL